MVILLACKLAILVCLLLGLKGGRTANGQKIDHSVGFDRILPIGTLVNRGDVVARLHARDEDSAKLASEQYLAALAINSQASRRTTCYLSNDNSLIPLNSFSELAILGVSCST